MNINITFRLFFKFVDVSNVLITFNNFTSCSIIACPVTLWINLTYWIVTFWHQFVNFTISCCDSLRTIVYYCIVVFIDRLFIFISDIIFNLITIDIYIVNINITFRLFFEFVDIGNIFIFFSNWTCNRVWSCKVTIWVNLTYFVVTCWYQFVCLTFEFDFFWTIIYYCVIVFINRLFIFICYWSFNSCSFSIFIVNVNTSFFIWLNKVIIYISRWFNRSWNRVVIGEWYITLQIRVYFTIWCCWVICNRSFCLNFWVFPSNNIKLIIGWWGSCKRTVRRSFKWTWISMHRSIHLFICISLCSREPTCDN